jgi:cytochrome o ubiquinol oxidase subunit III
MDTALGTKTSHHLHDIETYDKATFGFWLYLMTDLITFAVLFAVYAVLHTSTFGGPSAKEIFELPLALTETLILLTSSFTAGLAILAVHKKDKNKVLLWFGVTFLLGLAFLAIELSEFNKLISEGYSWQKSAFLSSFFALVGTHGLHITGGLVWMLVSMVMVWRKGLTVHISRKLTLLSLFWHFLDIVWIFIFTVVYLMGAV